MEIVALVLFANAVFILGGTAALAHWLRLWPLHERLSKTEDPDPRRARQGAWWAVGLCLVMSAYSSWVCVRIERTNELAGTFLPMEGHPKGWRWSRDDERLFRMERRLAGERPLTRAEQADYVEWVREVETINTLHRTVEEALRLYVLVPLALAWLLGLALARGVPRPVRLLSLVAVPCNFACGYVLISRGVYTALTGD